MELQEFIEIMNAEYKRAGCYHSTRNPIEDYTSGNHNVINATYYLITKKLGILNPENFFKYIAASAEAYNFIENCRDITGTFNRAPVKLEHNAHDDYIGIITTNVVFKLTQKYDIYEYGNKWRFPKFKGITIPLKWYYDNTEESKEFDVRCWFGRFFWTTAVFKAAAGKSLSLIDKLAYTGYLMSTVWFDNDRTSTSGKILKWLTIETMKGKSKMIDWAINKFEAYIKTVYPTGYMGEVLGVYHGVHHPFSKAMWRKL